MGTLCRIVTLLLVFHAANFQPPLVERTLAHVEPLRNLRDRIAPFGNLTHRVALETSTQIGFAQKAQVYVRRLAPIWDLECWFRLVHESF